MNAPSADTEGDGHPDRIRPAERIEESLPRYLSRLHSVDAGGPPWSDRNRPRLDEHPAARS